MTALKVHEGGYKQKDEDDLVADCLAGAIDQDEFDRRIKLLQPIDDSKKPQLSLVPNN